MENLAKASISTVDKLYSDISSSLNNELSHTQHVEIMSLLINNLRDRTAGEMNMCINNAHDNRTVKYRPHFRKIIKNKAIKMNTLTIHFQI